jgi:uncharacterized tellurite resistance protein B-like protein
MKRLPAADRKKLLELVCSLAWSDLRVTPPERALLERILTAVAVSEEERVQARKWLEVPPGNVDPTEVPREHRRLFLEAARAMIEADGRVVPAERDSLAVLAELLQIDS